MNPEAFSFTVWLPREARWVGIVRDLCGHAGSYVNLPADDTAAFCDRVSRVAERAVEAGGAQPCSVSFDCANGELRVTIGTETIRQVLPA